MSKVILIIAALLTALVAGLFFSYSFSVIPGLGKLHDKEYIAAMQSINREIQNPFFFSVFFGAFFTLPLASCIYFLAKQKQIAILILAATVVYSFGVMAITIFGNVPLNVTLENFIIEGKSSEQINFTRMNFEPQWNQLNLMRTFCSTLSLVLVLLASSKRKNYTILP